MNLEIYKRVTKEFVNWLGDTHPTVKTAFNELTYNHSILAEYMNELTTRTKECEGTIKHQVERTLRLDSQINELKSQLKEEIKKAFEAGRKTESPVSTLDKEEWQSYSDRDLKEYLETKPNQREMKNKLIKLLEAADLQAIDYEGTHDRLADKIILIFQPILKQKEKEIEGDEKVIDHWKSKLESQLEERDRESEVYETVIGELKSQLKEVNKLLEVSKCPNCDGSGAKHVPDGYGDWEAEQCQWCHERKLFLETKPKEKGLSSAIPIAGRRDKLMVLLKEVDLQVIDFNGDYDKLADQIIKLLEAKPEENEQST